MAMAADTPRSVPLPLFSWQDAAEATRLDGERRVLKARILRLPPRSFRRVVLEARLADVTARQLRLEADMRRLR